MAAIIFGAGALAYDQVQKTRQKKKDRRAHNDARFAQLEQDNSDRIAHIQSNTCFCQRSDWRGGGCLNHGYLSPAPGYSENIEDDEAAAEGRRAQTDSSTTVRAARNAPPRGYEATNGRRAGTRPSSQYHYVRGEEEGAFVEKQKAPPAMGDEHVRRINEERRKRMKTGGFASFILRKKAR